VDPVARKFMWSVIAKLAADKHSTVVLSTHSMEECEALCTKTVIMTNGVFRTINSNVGIKAEYAQGYELYVKFARPKFDQEKKDLVSWDDVVSEVAREDRGVVESDGVSSSDFAMFLKLHGTSDSWKKFSPFFHPSTLKPLGSMPRVVVDEWLFAARKFFALHEYLRNIFPLSFHGLVQDATAEGVNREHTDAAAIGSNLLERHGFVAKFRLPTSISSPQMQAASPLEPVSPGSSGSKQHRRRESFSMVANELIDYFSKFENIKERLGIAEYSLSPTSLEEVFQMFARQQEEVTTIQTERGPETKQNAHAAVGVSG